MVSVRRVAPVLLLAVTIAMPSIAAKAKKSSTSDRPPRELHLVGDHWTPYLPPDPATYPPNAKTHTIKTGETLWGLAHQYYGNGYLWPQLWEANTWITDAHWIYPGDVLLVTGETSQASVATETTTEQSSTLTGGQTGEQPAAESTAITTAEVRRESPPVPLGTEADVYCYGYIGDPREPMPNFLSAFEDVEVMSQPGVANNVTGSAGDLVFVAGGTATGLVAGETYMLVEPGEVVKHPRTGAEIGRHYGYRGQIRILCAEETTSRAMITQSCREIPVGARLKPMPEIPIPIARVPEIAGFCDPPTGRASGYIISSADWELGLATGNLVQVNVGRDDQIQPGDFLTVYRESPGLPRQAVGEIGILTTESHTATGRIVASRRSMFIGDTVEAR